MKRFLACGFLAAVTCLAYAQDTINDSVEFKIKNVNSGLVLGITNASQTAGATVLQWADTGTTDHLWHFIPMGNNQYLIENMLTHQVMGVSGASKSDGAQILQWADNSTADHLWTISTASDGNYMIKNVNSGLYLEVYDASTSDTAKIDQWGPTGSKCQEWQLENTGVTPYPMPGAVNGSGIYVHDPFLLKAGSTYWLYGTHNTLANSSNRTTFTSQGAALSPIPSWVSSYSGSNDVWAPDVVYHNGLYWQYYAASTAGSKNSAIGVATSTTPQSGNWADYGIVVSSSSSTAYNAIDPGITQDASGNWWMSFGSWSDGIYLMQIDPGTGKQLSSNKTIYHLAQRSNGLEGSYIYSSGGYYYLFASIDNCCEGASSTYHVIVGRSSSITGPYLDRGGLNMLSGGGTIVLSAHSNIDGPGGQGVMNDTDGAIFYYHYYDGNNNGTPTLGINLMSFTSDGWPYLH